MNGVLSTGCGSNDNSGTLEMQHSRQKSSENSHNGHLALSVEIIDNSNSDETERDDEAENVKEEDGPPEQDDFFKDNQESSGANFSSLSHDCG